jgi:hypothetical protein
MSKRSLITPATVLHILERELLGALPGDPRDHREQLALAANRV